MLNEKIFVTAIIAFLILGGISIYINQTNINRNTETNNQTITLVKTVISDMERDYVQLNKTFSQVNDTVNGTDEKLNIMIKLLMLNDTKNIDLDSR